MCKRISFFVTLLLLFTTACTGGLLPDPSTPVPPTGTPTPPGVLKIVFIGTDNNVWMWTQANHSLQLTSTGDARAVSLSDDGNHVAYLNKNGDLSVLDLTGQAPTSHQLISGPYLKSLSTPGDISPQIQQFDFIPSTSEVMLVIKVVAGSGGNDIFRVNAKNSQPLPTRVFAPGECGEMHFSPDGKWVVMALQTELILSKIDGTNSIPLFDNFPADLALGARGGPDVVWETDSSAFYALTPTFRDGIRYGTSTVWRVPLLAPKPETKIEFPAQASHLAYLSPHASRVLFVYDYGDTNDYRLVNNGAVSTLFTFPRGQLDFLGWRPPSSSEPDSTCFAFHQNDPQLVGLACFENNPPVINLTANPLVPPELFSWVDNTRFLYLTTGNVLNLQTVDSTTPPQTVGTISINNNNPTLPFFDFSLK